MLHTPTLKFKTLTTGVTLPEYKTELAAGLDVTAHIVDESGNPSSVTMDPSAIEVIPTGFAMAFPEGYEAQVRPRSGLSTKHGISIPNAPGTIDADYRGEVRIALINLSRVPFTINHGDRIAQIVISPVARAQIEIVEELGETQRGSGGFGSTGGFTSEPKATTTAQ